jgi:hypothetical protein
MGDLSAHFDLVVSSAEKHETPTTLGCRGFVNRNLKCLSRLMSRGARRLRNPLAERAGFLVPLEGYLAPRDISRSFLKTEGIKPPFPLRDEISQKIGFRFS